jgi:glycosyltransferase involved in cell wall biosynthesis
MSRRVLFIHHGARVSGAERSLLALASGLDRKRYEPLVVLPEDGTFPALLREAGVPTEILELPRATLRRPGLLLQGARRLRAFAAERAAKIVHANSFHAIKQARGATLLGGLPLVGSIRDMIPFTRPTLAAISSCDLVVCVSEATRAHLSRSISARRRDRLTVVYNGVETARFAALPAPERARRELGIPAGPSLCVGLLAPYVPWKGHRVLIEAAAVARERGVRLRIVLAGDESFSGPEYSRGLAEFASQVGVADRLSMLGFVERAELLLAALDVVVCASIEPDPLPRAVLEAMAAGRPVVGSRIGGVGEAVEHGVTGLLVPPGDAGALAAMLVQLAHDGSFRDRLGTQARERAERRFSIGAHCSRMQELYDELLARR